MGPNIENEFLRIAKCGSVVGLKGEISLWPISNIDERYVPGSVFYLNESETLEIETIRTKKDHYIARFAGKNRREDVESLVNKVLYSPPLEDSVLETGEFFVHDCIGKLVVDSSGTSRGKAIKFIANPANDLLELESGALVPFVFIDSVDDDSIYLNEPDGLFEIGEAK